MLPWFSEGRFPLYLAPMAGVTDVVFRTLCKELGADVMVTEFVSAEGILQADSRTRKYTEFTDGQRPVGVQLFGADGVRMGEAARRIIEWKEPDFIDINFGCPVNKVVSRNGGSSLLRDCPLLTSVAAEVVRAAAPIPVTAKIRIGWDHGSVNGPDVCRRLEDCGAAAIAVHGRTRAQGYRGEADWAVIAACADAVEIPLIGNGDIAGGEDVVRRRRETGIRGAMIGRAAMTNPWVFAEAKARLAGEAAPEPIDSETRWNFIRRHCRMAIDSGRYGDELRAMQAMRSRLMAYSRGMPHGKALRIRFSQVASLAELDDIAANALAAAAPDAAAA